MSLVPIPLPTRADLEIRLAEIRLKSAMAELLAVGGFTHLNRANVRLLGEVARENRAALARQGWIA